MIIIYLWSQQSNKRLIASLVKVSMSTVSKFLKIINELLSKTYYSKLPKLVGKDIIVELDISKFWKVEYYRGHKVECVWVFEMVEKTPQRKILLFNLEQRN